MRTLSRVVGVLFFLSGSALAQQLWKVNSGGQHGAHFLDLPAAVAAAAPGDMILVYNTSTASAYYTAPTVTKPLRIVGAIVGVPSPGIPSPGSVVVLGSVVVSGIAAGEAVVLTNLVIDHQPWPGGGGMGSLVIQDCAGSVLLDDVTYDGNGMTGQWVSIERSGDVVLRGCTLAIGGISVRIVDSNVLLSNTWIYVDDPFPLFGYGYTVQTETVFLQRSTMTLIGSLVRGSGPLNWQYPIPRSAVAMDASTLRVGASTMVQGGQYPGYPSWLPGSYAAAFTFVTPAPSVVERDPRAYPFSHPYLQPPSIVTLDETYHDWVLAGEDFHVSVLGPGGGFAMLFFGDMIPPVSTPIGVLGIDPFTAIPVDVVPLPTATQGAHQWTFPCPSSAPSGYAFALQCLTLSPTGGLGLTQPSPLTVGWGTMHIP